MVIYSKNHFIPHSIRPIPARYSPLSRCILYGKHEKCTAKTILFEWELCDWLFIWRKGIGYSALWHWTRSRIDCLAIRCMYFCFTHKTFRQKRDTTVHNKYRQIKFTPFLRWFLLLFGVMLCLSAMRIK